jgi:hypothetical protein
MGKTVRAPMTIPFLLKVRSPPTHAERPRLAVVAVYPTAGETKVEIEMGVCIYEDDDMEPPTEPTLVDLTNTAVERAVLCPMTLFVPLQCTMPALKAAVASAIFVVEKNFPTVIVRGQRTIISVDMKTGKKKHERKPRAMPIFLDDMLRGKKRATPSNKMQRRSFKKTKV